MDTIRVDLNLLVTLEALLAELNVTKAAARLNLSQPAVSAQLSRLRDLFEDPLLVPVRRGMMPTAKALEVLDPLRRPSTNCAIRFKPTEISLLREPISS